MNCSTSLTVSCLKASTKVRDSGGVLLDAIEGIRKNGVLGGEVESLLDRMWAALTLEPEMCAKRLQHLAE